jgi:uncharacterized membrane protein YoaK (UPF0700 family)
VPPNSRREPSLTAIPFPRPASQPAAGAKPAGQDATPGLRSVLVVLTLASGLLDAACYLGMGHVFVANMTGNVVFLGFALGGAKGFSIAASLVALGAFLLGAAAGGRLNVALSGQRHRWLTAAATTQLVLAAAAAIAAAAGALGPAGNARFGIIALLGAAMGMQNATARKLAVPDLTTTVLTLTLTGLAADSSLAGGGNPRMVRRATAVAAMLAGAMAGAALMVRAGFTVTLAVVAGVYAAVAVGFAVFAGADPAGGARAAAAGRP